MSTTNKLSKEYQDRWSNNSIFDESLLGHIDNKAQLHRELRSNTLSSAAACLNVLSNIKDKPDDIKQFFQCFSLEIDQVLNFPTGVNIQDEVYNDIGPIVFEWIGPQLSPLYEKSGSRPEFTSKRLDQWAYFNHVELDFIRPGKPADNGIIEAFNGRLGQECLNESWFLSLEDARQKVEAWRQDYNEHRPHGALGNVSPMAYAASLAKSV